MRNWLAGLRGYLLLGLLLSTPPVLQAGEAAGGFPGLAVREAITFTCLADTDLGSCVGVNDVDATKRVLIKDIGEPCALEYDRQGNLYIGTDTRDSSGTYALYKYTPAGKLTNLGYIIQPTFRATSWDLDLAVSPSGEVYFTHLADKVRGTGVSKIQLPEGNISLVAKDIGEPSALEFDSKGNLYIGTDTRNPAGVHDIYKLTPAGKLTNLGHVMIPTFTAASWSFDLAISAQDEVYFTHLADQVRGSGVSRIDASGAIKLVLDGIGEPCALAFDHSGNLYVGTDTRSDGYHLLRWNARYGTIDFGRLIHQLFSANSWTLDLAFPPTSNAVLPGNWRLYR